MGISQSTVATTVPTFEQLQERLVPLWESMRSMTADEQTIVVVPSISIAAADDHDGAELQALEERFLFLLFLLRQPRARMIYVTSQPIMPEIVDYYLDLLPGVIASQARQRLHLVNAGDSASRSLSEKLLSRPRVLGRIRDLIPDPARAHLVPYSTTERERDLAVALGIPMYATDPAHFVFGTKTGCRRLFHEEQVPHPLGYEGLTSRADVADAVARLRAAKPHVREVLVKLNEGASGSGNALLALADLPPAGEPGEMEAIGAALGTIELEADELSREEYWARLEKLGGVVEERIVGDEVRSPSVQMRVTPLGELEILSTHDQLLGGKSGQTYLGCVFPAEAEYASMITNEAVKVGVRLAKEGVIGRFAIDFLVTRQDDGAWEVNAIEINLRKGGTTHPYLTLQFLTDGSYHPQDGLFSTRAGQPRYFVATDHAEVAGLKGLSVEDLFELAVVNGIHYDHTQQTGVVFHMLSAVPQHGQVGFTAVDGSPDGARELYEHTVGLLAAAAEGAWTDV